MMMRLQRFSFTMLPWLLLWLVVEKAVSNEHLCSASRLLSLEPTKAKHRIILPFPLYENDCQTVKPHAVQSLFAVKWALEKWHSNSLNVKIALTVIGLCSDDREIVAETYKLLDKYGYYKREECLSPRDRQMLYMMIPEINLVNSSSLNNFFQTLSLPLITFSTATTQMKFIPPLRQIYSSAATFDDYATVVCGLLEKMANNWVSVVYSKQHLLVDVADNFIAKLSSAGVVVEQRFDFATNNNVQLVPFKSRSKIVVVLLTAPEMQIFISLNANHLRGLFIVSVPIGDVEFSLEQRMQLYSNNSQFSILFLQSQARHLLEFENYFTKLFKQNNHAYGLLASYAHSQYNCTLVDVPPPGWKSCTSFSERHLKKSMASNTLAESAILATYAVANLAMQISNFPATNCTTADQHCHYTALWNKLQYTFDNEDLAVDFRGFEISFDDKQSLKSITIQGRYLTVDGQFRIVDKLVLEYKKRNGNLNLYSNLYLPDGRVVDSVCPWNSFACRACSTVEMVDSVDKLSLVRPGNLYLVGLFDLRTWNPKRHSCVAASSNENLALAATFAYTLETVKQKYAKLNLLPNVELGGILIDTCHCAGKAAESLLNIRGKCLSLSPALHTPNISVSYENVFAFVTGQTPSTYPTVKSLFQNSDTFFQPLISASCQGNSCSKREISLRPSLMLQARALIALLNNYNWNLVTVLVSDSDPTAAEMFRIFETQALAGAVCIGQLIHIDQTTTEEEEAVNSSSSSSSSNNNNNNNNSNCKQSVLTITNPVIVVFSDADQFARFLKRTTTSSRLPDNSVFLLTGQSHNFIRILHLDDSWNSSPSSDDGAAIQFLSLQPAAPDNRDLAVFLSRASPLHLPQEWLVSFWEELLQCKLQPTTTTTTTTTTSSQLCTDIDESQFLLPTSAELISERYLMAALEGWIILTDDIYKKVCPDMRGLCDEFYQRYPRTMSAWLHLLKSLDKFTIFQLDPFSQSIAEIGQWSDEDGLVMSNQNWNVQLELPQSRCSPPSCRCYELRKAFSSCSQVTFKSQPNYDTITTGRSDTAVMPVISSRWTSSSWNYLFLALNSILISITLGVFVLILYKMARHVVKGNQSLGICLLCAILSLYSTVFLFTFDPTDTLCRMRQFCHSLAYCLCFGVLIAKATQLRNGETVGTNGYISHWNYWLLLFFIVSVQIALNFQWTIFRSTAVLHFDINGHHDQDSTFVASVCGWSDQEFLASHGYVFLLLIIVLFISFINRNVKRNYKETRWLLYTCLSLVPVWIGWTVSYAFVAHPYKDAVICVELITSATIMMLLMFGPKIYLLLCYEPILIQYPSPRQSSIDHLKDDNIYNLDIYFDNGDETAGQCESSAADVGVFSAHASNSSSNNSINDQMCNNSISSGGDSAGSTKYQAVIWKKSRSKRIMALNNASS
ncbi:Metabotropic glutamate receptor 7 [Trichinella pseudospiralis]|uniref:Metabotropic glutamate receptor 7 n=1 Tax=Trichinella pseudospiralis TaxID=6337 RepID=A0A0V1FS08_TRIPS|nr:Metabotropic glutamate receptor 7 [Trichinella pseudospiralis]